MWRVVLLVLVACGGSAVRPEPCDPCPGTSKESVYFGYQAEPLTVCLGAPRCQGAAWFQSKTDADPAECSRAATQWQQAQTLPDYQQCLCNSRCATPPCAGCY